MLRRFVVLAVSLLALTAQAQTVRKALLIGIDDYTASTLRSSGAITSRDREWPDLKGAANDVEILREMLVALHGFKPEEIVTLTNQEATRAAILQAIERHLIAPAAEGSVAFFYYAGHGAQVPNSASDEPDRLDESIVPADSRRGAPDIRDKELRSYFHCILDRGARLTLLLDHCHSGSGFRGLPIGARPRGIGRAPRIHDARDYGPRPEERGALVFASTQDLDEAWETLGDDGRMHGAFTWAWIRAMRDAAPGEPAEETFLRAQARLRHEMPFQAPVMLGPTEARRRPFLAADGVRVRSRTTIAVERVEPDGRVVLQGGWAHGLHPGTLLRLRGDGNVKLRVTSILGPGRAVARVDSGRRTSALRSGALVEVVAWSAPPGRALRISIPRALRHIVRAETDGVVAVDEPQHADYILTSRRVRGTVEYAWRRPLSRDGDAAQSALPARTAAVATLGDAATLLRKQLLTLRRLHAWHTLESPSQSRAPYRLELQREPDKQPMRGHRVTAGETFSVVLRASQPLPAHLTPRYYYVFAIDSAGRSSLIYPRAGSVENRFPIRHPAPADIPLGHPSAFRIAPPYGLDTYFLLSTEEPLANVSILEWDGVRAPAWTNPLTPLETLLWLTMTGNRASRAMTPTRWSIERLTLHALPPSPAGSRVRGR